MLSKEVDAYRKLIVRIGGRGAAMQKEDSVCSRVFPAFVIKCFAHEPEACKYIPSFFVLCFLTACSSNQAYRSYGRAQGTYNTTFPIAENSISEGGNWINGRDTGLDWANIQTVPGLSMGTQSGEVQYNDSTALVTGVWAPNQVAEAQVHSINQDDNIFEEVELHLRSTLGPHRATGYEIMFRCSKSPKAYAGIARWNGAYGDFTELKSATGAQFGVADGDTVRATIVGSIITAYINDAQVLQVSDDTYKSGNPGMGFGLWLNKNRRARKNTFGFTRFRAGSLE
jgi:hypothetical protein